MKLSKEIKDKILSDNELSLSMAAVYGIQQHSLFQLIARDSKKLTLYAAILFLHSKGFTDEQIFEQVPVRI